MDSKSHRITNLENNIKFYGSIRLLFLHAKYLDTKDVQLDNIRNFHDTD